MEIVPTMAVAARAPPIAPTSQPPLTSARRPASTYVTGFQAATVASHPLSASFGT